MKKNITKTEILHQATKLFRQKGYVATSIRDIGRASNITSAALYYHFKNKDQILLAIVKNGVALLNKTVSDAMNKAKEPIERVKSALRTHLQTSLENHDTALVILQETRHLPAELFQEILTERNQYKQLWMDMFDKAQTVGLIKEDVNISLLRLLTFGAINQVISWYQPNGRYQLDQIADSLFDYITRGVIINENNLEEKLLTLEQI